MSRDKSTITEALPILYDTMFSLFSAQAFEAGDTCINQIDDISFRIAEERLLAVLSATGPFGKGGGKSEIPQPNIDNAANQAVHRMRMNNEDFLKRQEAMLKAQGI